jgi:uncharacterized membrane protein HdeD (DUF308 family)
MEEFMKDFLKSSIATSIFLIILGILLVFQSEMTIMAISYVIGGILVAIGALALIRYIKKAADKESTSELDIIYGIVTIIFGVIIIQNYQALASIIPIVLGVTIIVSSVGKLNYAFQLKADDNQLWKTTMIISIISTICGVVLLFNPFSAAIGIMKIIGIFIIVYAILDLVSTIAIKSSVTKIYDAVEETIVDAEIIEDDKKKKAQKKTNKKSKK